MKTEIENILSDWGRLPMEGIRKTQLDLIVSLFQSKVEGIPEKTTRGYFDSSNEWIDGYKEGRKDVLKELREML